MGSTSSPMMMHCRGLPREPVKYRSYVAAAGGIEEGCGGLQSLDGAESRKQCAGRDMDWLAPKPASFSLKHLQRICRLGKCMVEFCVGSSSCRCLRDCARVDDIRASWEGLKRGRDPHTFHIYICICDNSLKRQGLCPEPANAAAHNT